VYLDIELGKQLLVLLLLSCLLQYFISSLALIQRTSCLTTCLRHLVKYTVVQDIVYDTCPAREQYFKIYYDKREKSIFIMNFVWEIIREINEIWINFWVIKLKNIDFRKICTNGIVLQWDLYEASYTMLRIVPQSLPSCHKKQNQNTFFILD
jgi:hypothetical protein